MSFYDFLDVLADAQGIEHLHVGKAVEEQDAVGELVGVLHLLDGFLAPDLGHFQKAPIVQEPVMQPVLADGGEFAAQALVEIIDDFWVALHGALRVFLRPNWPETIFRTLLNQFRGKSNLSRRKRGCPGNRANSGIFRKPRARTRGPIRPRGRGCAGSPSRTPWRRGRALLR